MRSSLRVFLRVLGLSALTLAGCGSPAPALTPQPSFTPAPVPVVPATAAPQMVAALAITSPPLPTPAPTLLPLAATPAPQPATAAPEPSVSPGVTTLPGYWPTQDWRASTPEEQGMDSEQLAKMLDYISQRRSAIHSVVVIRHGYIVAEAYYYPLTPDIKHDLASCTKSFTSALVGVALQEGSIKSLDQRVLDFFPDRTAANPDPRKAAITVENLLTMSSGLAWAEYSIGSRTEEMVESRDWVQFVLDQPMAEDPGKTWNYNSGGPHLLSAIAQKTTRMTLLAYAQARLFGPLGIKEVTWPADPQGITMGAFGLHLSSRDMAKLGYLYLHEGAWEGKQVVPAEWVQASRRQRFQPAPDEGYGYLWWVQPFGTYAAEGSGGQYIYIAPDLDLVAVFTGDESPQQPSVSTALMQFFVLSAAKSQGPLAANPSALTRLQALARAAQQGPAATTPAPLPPLATQIAGKTYLMNANPLGWQTLKFGFEKDTASIEVFDAKLQSVALVGLDGRFRTSNVGAMAGLAARGRWTDGKTFTMDAQFLGDPSSAYTFSFAADSLTVQILDRSGLTTRIEGHLQP